MSTVTKVGALIAVLLIAYIGSRWLGVGGFFAVLIVAAVVARWWGNRTYRPTSADVRRILDDAVAEKLNLGAFDEFSSVPITHDAYLEQLRRRFNDIARSPENETGRITVKCAICLTDNGKAAVRGLIAELDAVQPNNVLEADEMRPSPPAPAAAAQHDR